MTVLPLGIECNKSVLGFLFPIIVFLVVDHLSRQHKLLAQLIQFVNLHHLHILSGSLKLFHPIGILESVQSILTAG